MPDRPTLLAALAHPDDESRIIGGTLAKYAAEGVRVVLYCATEGEAWRAGADRDEQRRLRRRELAAACATLGIAEVRLRAFPDGGLDLLDADVLAADIAATIRDCAPQVVVAFGPEGRTLHPDHIALHHATTRAVALARQDRDPAAPPTRLYYTTVAASVAEAVGWRFPATPDAAIDATLDVTPWLDRKRRATVTDHASQYHDPPFSNVDEAARWRALAREDFVLAVGSRPLPPGERSDLFAGLR